MTAKATIALPKSPDSTSNATKKPAAPQKPAGAKSSKATHEVDHFGNRVGSQAARINAAMTKKPQTAADIAKASKLGVPRVLGHMRYLVGRKVVEESKDGFALK